jgi:uncharacterized repeat protein (TIGR01451 family)
MHLLTSVPQRPATAVQGPFLTHRRLWLCWSGVLAGIVVVASCVGVSPARAVAPAPAWAIEGKAMPTDISPSNGGQLTLLATNTGGAPTDGSAVTVTDTLPPGLNVSRAVGRESPNLQGLECEHTTSTVTCTYHPEVEVEPGVLAPVPVAGESTDGLVVNIEVSVEPGVTGTLMNTTTVAGGGAASVSRSEPVVVSAQEPPFGFSGLFSSNAYGVTGAFDTQAGGHPDSDTTGFVINSAVNPTGPESIVPVQEMRDSVVDLPKGFVGNPLAAPTCPQYLLNPPGGGRGCPAASVIGSIARSGASQGWGFTSAEGGASVHPLFNVAPEHGHPAQFAFVLAGQEITLYPSLVHTAAGYVVRVTVPSVLRLVVVTGLKVTFFGNPAVHDGGLTPSRAFFTNPTDCNAGPLATAIHLDSWQNPGRVNPDGSPDLSDPAWKTAESVAPPTSGCESLRFDPELEVTPDTAHADSPTGGSVDLRIPQNNDPAGLATPELKEAVVALPAGFSVDPAVADGLAVCTDAQFAVDSTEPAGCPNASQVGTAEVHSPLLDHPIQGVVFVGSPLCGPCSDADAAGGRMLRLFLQFADPASGVVIKLPGTVSADPVTGRLTATFADAPQLPFDDLKLRLKNGPRAPLETPQACGTYTTSSSLTPWSAPQSGPPATLSSAFEVTSGCGNGFAPGFTAGTVNNQAGAFSPLSVSFSRQDGEQDLGGVSVTTPPGLLGLLKGVERCPEPQAAQGSCGAGSLIGHATASAGAGPNPFTVQGGQVFLTGPYRGAPFGLSIVVPAVAGPFNLGNVVVRAAIQVDPHTAQITVVSDSLPTIIDGIPLRVKTVNVSIDRQGFIFNPTSCEPLTVGGALTSTQGATVNVSSRFQAANCANLGFRPSFSVSTQARTSKKQGASLDVKVGYPQGAQANIHAVAVSLPKQLPARLTTIQQACLAATFDANPAACPVGSNIGTATAGSPVLANPVTGPAYLVSHGGAAFPDLVVVLQGEGITLDLVGSIDIKHNITSSTFASVPDAPISSFELKLPEGPHSGLAAVIPAKAKGNMCGQSLTMPTTITGQNGAVVKQTTKIAVTGCATAKKKAKRAKGKKPAQGSRRTQRPHGGRKG